MQIKFENVVIIGPGLIGGSIGILLRKLKIASNVIGVARHGATLKKAMKKKSIDVGITDIKKAVAQADLVIIATPVMAIKRILHEIKDVLKKECIIFDVGSTKTEIVFEAEKVLPEDVHFIGTHPMSGSEKAGAEFADEGLFKNSICFITRTRKSNRKAFSTVNNLWRMLDVNTVLVSPQEHDNIVAEISHLPHLISVALVDTVQTGFLKFASTGFKDTTRIAAGDPDIWRDISFSNKDAILNSITAFEKKLSHLKKSIKSNQKPLLFRELIKVKKKRDSIK